MPAAPAGPPQGGGGPAKTMFGYAAPVRPPMPSQPQPPTTGMQPPRPQTPSAPPPQPGYGAPPQQPGYGAPPQQPGYGAPPQPPAPQPGYGAPPQQPGFPPPQQPGFPPPQQQGYPPPPQQQGYPPPQQPGYGAPPQQPGFPPPQQQGYPPPQQPGYPPPQQPGYPPPPQHAGLANMASHIPQSAPGTLFGFPLSKLREASVQRTMLMLAGIALVASIVVPLSLSPTIFPFSSGVPKWDFLVWPLISGAAYLFIAAAPADLRAKVPPMVLHWAPFAISYAGVIISKFGFSFMAMGAGAGGFGAGIGLYSIGYTTLVFGLLARLAQPEDAIARFVIMAGAAMCIPFWIDSFDALGFHGPFLFAITGVLWFLVNTVAVASILFVINGVRFGTVTVKLPPALASLDAFVPAVTALLIVWLPALHVLIGLSLIVHAHAAVSGLLIMAHGLLPVFAYFGVLMVTAPAAYDEFKKMISGGGGQAQPPQQGGGYPPPGGGYPPPGGGYPPPGGGYPPPGGGYPPQGGGWPQQ